MNLDVAAVSIPDDYGAAFFESVGHGDDLASTPVILFKVHRRCQRMVGQFLQQLGHRAGESVDSLIGVTNGEQLRPDALTEADGVD